MSRGLSRSLLLLGLITALLATLALVTRRAGVAAASPAETTLSVESSATTPTPLAMKSIGTAQQLVIATCAKLGDTTGTVQFWDVENGSWVCTMSVPCRFGRKGVMDGVRRWAGNNTTPTGLWKMPSFIFGYAKSAPVGTKMRFVRITKRSWWSSKRGSTYNAWVEAKKWPGEYLYHVVPQYELAVSTGYNAKPNTVVYGRGSGIFLHIWGKGFTSGCVAISRANMIRACTMLDPAKHPAFAVGTLKTGGKTSIWAY